MSLKKRYLLGKEARAKMLEGAKVVYDLVSPTSGPKGRNIAYARPWGLPRIINDGIEIAKEVGSEDDFVNVGIDLIREAAQNTVTDAGDGTTTSIILAYELLKAGTERIEKGENPMVIRTEILETLALLIREIPKLSTKIKTKEELYSAALISSSGDEEIAKVVSDTVWEMGKDGIVTAEEGNGMVITSEITRGMQLQKGYLDPMFVTNEMRMESTIVNPAIVIFEKTVSSGMAELAPIMNEVAKHGKKDIVIFGDLRGDALATAVLNKVRGTFSILAVNPPEYQEQRLAILQDIAILTGAQVITSATQTFTMSMVGSASHVSANKTTTNIVGGKGAKEAIEGRARELREKLEGGENTLYEREKYEERLSKLSSGVALIKVGAKSETLKRERFEKTKDAIGASKAALNEGVVVGGGMAFIALANFIMNKFKTINTGNIVLNNALASPTRKLLINAGKSEQEVDNIMDDLFMARDNFGYNITNDKIEDLMKAGVIDPARVIRLALENAVFVATSMLTAEGIITDAPKDEKQQ